MKKLIIGVLLLSAFVLIGCKDADQARLGALNEPHRIELLDCSGKTAREWISTGAPSAERQSDGYYFLDQNSHELIRVSGNLVITRISSKPPVVTIQ